MRLLFLILLLANVIAYGWIRHAESRAGADAQFPLLQINPEKMRLRKPGEPAAGRGNAAAQAAPACLEWGAFAADDAPRAEAALVNFELGDKVSRRENSDSYWVYVPPFKTKTDADRKATEIKALGISDLYVVQDNSGARYAISLGAFKTEDAANNFLAQLKLKGVRSALVGPRGTRTSVFVIRDPGDAVTAKLAALRADFPAAQLKAIACAGAQQAKN
jgi:hypothetical protein